MSCCACACKLFNRFSLFFVIVVLNTNEKIRYQSRQNKKGTYHKKRAILYNLKGILLLHPP